MAFSLNINSFIYNSLLKNLKQFHLDEKYSVASYFLKDVPSNIKKMMKDAANSNFATGANDMFVFFKANDPSKVKDEDRIKLENMVTTTFFKADSDLSIEEFYKLEKTKGKDDEKETVGNVYFVCKFTIEK